MLCGFFLGAIDWIADGKFFSRGIHGKNFKNDSNQKLQLVFRRIFPFILGWFWPFYVVFWRFASFFNILCCFLPLGVVFSPKTTATSCQDADVFPGTSRGHYGPYDILDPMVQGPGVEISSVSTFRLLCLWDFCLSCLGSRGNSLPELLSHYQRKKTDVTQKIHILFTNNIRLNKITWERWERDKRISKEHMEK